LKISIFVDIEILDCAFTQVHEISSLIIFKQKFCYLKSIMGFGLCFKGNIEDAIMG
jgi:hypothetical protein